ncbi:DUF2079 domain-containing protein [Brachybacterium sp. EF45031]|uniref:DUF2079 domain-containing protein n=1 Tax=Brachybacterium sillae TaxID=2810536 RepID=UPI00217CED15|nr:DUF2079 domain-containing protein [Brachybacterium sillae]MCS6711401.1 DUF2079 domain-containing protein [Brachybacterium sillae]
MTPAAPDSPAATPRTPDILVPTGIALVATVLYGTLSTLQWRSLEAPSWDLGIFTELVKAYGTLSAPIVPIKGDGVNLLGDHFHPALVVLAPLWWVWPSGLALMWAQAALFGVSAVPLTRAARALLGPAWGTVTGVTYAFSFGLQAAQDVQFHEIALAVPLLAASLAALLRGRVGASILWAAPLVFVKEDLGLTVLMLGAVIAWRHTRYRREGVGLALWGVGWFVLSTAVILPLMNTAGRYDYTDRLGSPWLVLVPAEKWGTVLLLVIAAGVVGVRSPLVLLMLPTLAWRFTGTVPFYWGWEWHYSAVLMPIATAALVDALAHTPLRSHGWLRGPSVLSAGAATAVLGASLPLVALTNPHTWEPSPRLGAARTAMAAAPEGSVVATDLPLLAPMVPGHDVQWIHGVNRRVPDCAVIDELTYPWEPGDIGDPATWAEHRWGVPFRTVVSVDGFHTVCR